MPNSAGAAHGAAGNAIHATTWVTARWGGGTIRLDVVRYGIVDIGFELELPDGVHPFFGTQLEAEAVGPDGARRRVAAFWRRSGWFGLRYSPYRCGEHSLTFAAKTIAAYPALGRFRIIIEARPYDGANPLYRHGPIGVDTNSRIFRHHDGEPFFLLADTWWFGMSARLRFPGEFNLLLDDRRRKGFSALQFAMGFACDIAPFDPRDRNEAGFMWERDFASVNPRYFEYTDRRIRSVVEHGLVPNIVGMWGYYLPLMGREKAKAHWRYLIARYGALPVLWTLCGESRLTYYEERDPRRERALFLEQNQGWADIGAMVRRGDPWHHPVTVHTGPAYNGADCDPLSDMRVTDFYLLQPGHSEHDAVDRATAQLDYRRDRHPEKPVLVGECAFEGMHGGTGPKVQRNLFWALFCSGAPGHCYGADALWQMNRRGEPFGQSVAGHTWGNAPWQDAYRWDGSLHVGIGRRIVERFAWWRFEPHREWISPAFSRERPEGAFAAGIPGTVRLFYFPRTVSPWGTRYRVLGLWPDVGYSAYFVNPLTGEDAPIGQVGPSEAGEWVVPKAPILHDWLLVVEPLPGSDVRSRP